ncbi:MAG: hypothetical protein R3D98_04535 [Candidatus Krumholzibacteriia bacterium]
MVRLLTLLIVLGICLPAAAADLTARQPAKPVPAVTPALADPAVLRQGGDTIADGVVIPGIPYYTSGTTVGFTDDYDEACPYAQSTSPDVVYLYTPTVDELVEVDLEGSSYDTKVYIYDDQLNLVACNDDYYPDYTSLLQFVQLEAGVTYAIVIDGYGGAAGQYVMDFVSNDLYCVIDCPPGAQLEGEPAPHDGYVDDYNGGCGSAGPDAFQDIDEEIFCGRSGWYLDASGWPMRDTDWLVLTFDASGAYTIIGDAEVVSHLCELGPQDCFNTVVVQEAMIGPCVEEALTVTGAPGTTVWIWVAPVTFTNPGYPDDVYDYVLAVTGGPVAVEHRSWSAIKGLYAR